MSLCHDAKKKFKDVREITPYLRCTNAQVR